MVLFTVTAALLPIGLRWMFSMSAQKGVDFVELFGGGDLFLISVGISSVTLGDLIGAKFADREKQFVAFLCGGVALLVILFCSGLFAYNEASSDLDPNVLANISFVFCGCAIVSGAAGVSISGMEDGV